MNSLFYSCNTIHTPHCFTSRQGGVSLPPYDSFNLKYPTGDESETYQFVLSNRQKLAQTLGFELEHLVTCQQVHGNQIHQVQLDDRGKGAFQHQEGIPETDALITNQKGIALLVMVADCVPILLNDPTTGVIAAIHAGWRGTAKQILTKTLNMMLEDYQCQKENIQVAIGPSIGQCCFEVDRPVIEHFKDQIDIQNPHLIQAKGIKYFPNLKQINRIQAMQTGIISQNIQILDICTYCDHDFYSYRRENGITGRLAGVIVQT